MLRMFDLLVPPGVKGLKPKDFSLIYKNNNFVKFKIKHRNLTK